MVKLTSYIFYHTKKHLKVTNAPLTFQKMIFPTKNILLDTSHCKNLWHGIPGDFYRNAGTIMKWTGMKNFNVFSCNSRPKVSTCLR